MKNLSGGAPQWPLSHSNREVIKDRWKRNAGAPQRPLSQTQKKDEGDSEEPKTGKLRPLSHARKNFAGFKD